MRSNVDPVADREAKISGALPTDLVRPLDWLGHNLSEPIQLERLADIAGVRPRTLETHFRTFLRTTPLGWVQPMRLARARQQLLQASRRPPSRTWPLPTASVGSAGLPGSTAGPLGNVHP